MEKQDHQTIDVLTIKIKKNENFDNKKADYELHEQ
jgi:hypothetical protein